MDANMQLTINSFRQFSLTRFFPNNSLTLGKIPDISLTAVKFPDISRFSRQVVTLYYAVIPCLELSADHQHRCSEDPKSEI